MGRGVVDRLGRYIPLTSVKIIVVAWQILTQVSGVGVTLDGSFMSGRIYARKLAGDILERRVRGSFSSSGWDGRLGDVLLGLGELDSEMFALASRRFC